MMLMRSGANTAPCCQWAAYRSSARRQSRSIGLRLAEYPWRPVDIRQNPPKHCISYHLFTYPQSPLRFTYLVHSTTSKPCLIPKKDQNYASTPKINPNPDQVDLDCTKSSNLCSSPLPNPSLDHSPSPDGTNPNPALGPDPASQLALWSIWGTLDVLSDGDSGLEEGIAGDLVMFGLTVPGRWSGES